MKSAARRVLAKVMCLSLFAGSFSLVEISDGAPAPAPQDEARQEARYYEVQQYRPPRNEVIEVGGMDFLDEDTLLVSTRRGRVWWVSNALADDPTDAKWHVFAEGLYEGLGLAVADGEIYVVQRGELSKLVDHDGDHVCDEIVTFADDWGMTGNYHEFAYGLPRDLAGNFYVSLNVAFFSPEWWHGVARAPYRGWIMKISPDGQVTPFASGVRSPCGLGANSKGEIFYTDNQGDWMATCPIFHVQEGEFYGHPASQRWTDAFGNGEEVPSSTVPLDQKRTPPAMWLPYEWSRSAGNLVEDTSGGAFGPYEGQMFVAELTNGMVLRTQMERVRGQYQGAAFLFRQNLGSVCRVAFAPDNSMLIGYTNRGWGGRGPSHGLGRLRWNGDTPFDMHSVHLVQEGFEVTFTQPIAADLTEVRVDAESYRYNYWWDYGSPIQDRTPVEVVSVEPLGDDGRRAFVRLKGLEPARCVRLTLSDLTNQEGAPLLHDTFHYTINQMPEGPLTDKQVSRLVAPPAVKTSDSTGWLHMTWGDAVGVWDHEGWELCDVDLDADDPSILNTRPGMGAIVNNGSSPGHFRSDFDLGDYEFRFKFMMPKGSDSGLYFMERYELQLVDAVSGIGGVVGVQDPRRGQRAYKGHGTWHTMTGRFFAPRFDESGNKTKNARIEAIAIDDVEIMPTCEPDGPTPGGKSDEVARAPIFIQGNIGKICLGDIRVKALDDASEEGGPTGGAIDLLNDAGLGSWKSTGDALWALSDGVMRAGDGSGLLESINSDWVDYEIRMRLAVNDGGNAGLRVGWDGTTGYEAEINCTASAPSHTGSLVGLDEFQTDLIPGGVGFDYVVRYRRTAEGTDVRVFLNGVQVSRHTDATSRLAGSKVALEIGPGTELTVERFEVRRF